MNKQELRNEMLAKRSQLTKEEVAQKSEVISLAMEDFFKHLLMQNGLPIKVLSYMAYGNEVDLSLLHQKLWNMGITIALPVTEGLPEGVMIAVEYKPDTTFEKSSFGINEPTGRILVEAKDITVILAPGVAFDKFGNRLGHGAGYYDRYMADHDFLRLGIGYEMQIVEKMETEKTDVKLDGFICEKGRMAFNSGR